MKVTYIELLGERHPLCFSLAASEALDESFGGLDRMTQALSSGSLSQTAKAVDTVLQILMKAGRVYCGARGGRTAAPAPLPSGGPAGRAGRVHGGAHFDRHLRRFGAGGGGGVKKGRGRAGPGGAAWLYYNGARAGLTRFEVENLPIGRVFDQIACWQIAECGAVERHRARGSLMEQMNRLGR